MSQQLVYLASASARRAELLRQIGVEFVASAAAIDETPRTDEAPARYARRMAAGKALAGARAAAGRVVIGADTVVVVDGQILGKPRDQADAARMHALLAGRGHDVITSVALVADDNLTQIDSTSRVTMTPISARQSAVYWQSGEPRDKAGGYAIQGLGAVFVERIEGSYSGVVGLPLAQTVALLERSGFALWSTRVDE